MMSRLVIFDGNHLLYRAYYKFANLRTIEGIKTSIIYGVTYIIESLIRRLDADEVIVVFDGEKKSKYRLSILPNYKNRDKKLGWDAEDFFRQRDVSIQVLTSLGIKVARRKDLEADDVIAMLTRRYRKQQIIIVSGDKDFNQLITNRISVFSSNKGKMLTEQNIQQITGYLPNQTVDYLCLLGDDSDKIPGFPGIGEKKALNLLDTYGSIRKFLRSGDRFGKVDNEKLKEVYERNKKLINLKFYYRRFLKHDKIPFINTNPHFSEKNFKRYCGIYETNSFLKKQFIDTFKKLYHGE